MLAVLALLDVGAGRLERAALLMLAALVIDSVDGTLARAARVAQVVPRLDGRRLDDIVDYLNFAVVPAVFLAGGGLVPAWPWAALPVLASAYGFAQEDAKTPDHFFLGFPSYWNVVALYLWLLEVPPAAGAAVVAAFALGVFVPLKYIYPSRMPRFRVTTVVLGLAWLAAVVAGILAPRAAARLHLVELSLLFPAWYLGLSAWLGGWKHRVPAVRRPDAPQSRSDVPRKRRRPKGAGARSEPEANEAGARQQAAGSAAARSEPEANEAGARQDR